MADNVAYEVILFNDVKDLLRSTIFKFRADEGLLDDILAQEDAVFIEEGDGFKKTRFNKFQRRFFGQDPEDYPWNIYVCRKSILKNIDWDGFLRATTKGLFDDKMRAAEVGAKISEIKSAEYPKVVELMAHLQYMVNEPERLRHLLDPLLLKTPYSPKKKDSRKLVVATVISCVEEGVVAKTSLGMLIEEEMRRLIQEGNMDPKPRQVLSRIRSKMPLPYPIEKIDHSGIWWFVDARVESKLTSIKAFQNAVAYYKKLLSEPKRF